MPFKSEAQRSFMYANHPEIAKRWSSETKSESDLPERVQSNQNQPSNERRMSAMKSLIGEKK